MNTQAFNNPDQLLQSLLNDLQQRVNVATRSVSGKDIDMVGVVRHFYAETSAPHGRTCFVRYAIVFLERNLAANAVCRSPSFDEYETSWQGIRDYPTKVWQTQQKILRCLARFGEHLILTCIYPMMGRPNQSTPSTGTSQNRPSNLRRDCLKRDGNRCVVSGKFNLDELAKRWAGQYQDDDGNSLLQNGTEFEVLQVAHIIPHALGWAVNSDNNSVQHRMNVLAILDMFSPGTMGGYHGPAMDFSQNALTLEAGKHTVFGRLEMYFEPIQGSQVNYTVHHVNETIPGLVGVYPKNITFRTVPDVPSPDANLLATHRACARIAHATGAAEACMNFFRDLDDGTVEADGSTPLGCLVAYRMAFSQNSASDHQEQRGEWWGDIPGEREISSH